LRGKILIALGQQEAGGRAMRRVFTSAEQLHSPTVTYPLAYELGQWYESQGQTLQAAQLCHKAHDAVEYMMAAIENEALQSVFRQSETVQLLAQGLARTR
jgi:hypothetical protein